MSSEWAAIASWNFSSYFGVLLTPSEFKPTHFSLVLHYGSFNKVVFLLSDMIISPKT